jgi:hypothetical protein
MSFQIFFEFNAGHRICQKWGELLAEQMEKNSKLDNNLLNNSINEFALKGYVKFDLSIQSKGENSKVKVLI